MPQYRNVKLDRFQINVKPNIFFQRMWPYFVGNRVKFKLQIIDTESKMDRTSLNLFEIFNGEEKKLAVFGKAYMNNNWNTIIGCPIDREGDIIYRIGVSSKPICDEPIILGYVINTDRWLLGVWGFILGILGTIGAQFIVRILIQR
jgi:hypothetical protein